VTLGRLPIWWSTGCHRTLILWTQRLLPSDALSENTSRSACTPWPTLSHYHSFLCPTEPSGYSLTHAREPHNRFPSLSLPWHDISLPWVPRAATGVRPAAEHQLRRETSPSKGSRWGAPSGRKTGAAKNTCERVGRGVRHAPSMRCIRASGYTQKIIGSGPASIPHP